MNHYFVYIEMVTMTSYHHTTHKLQALNHNIIEIMVTFIAEQLCQSNNIDHL